MIKELKEKLKASAPYQIWKHFHDDILKGYHAYTQIMVKYGPDAQIYKTCGGTGDVYIAGQYFFEYLKVHHVKRKPVFTVIHESGYAVAELFGIENIETISYNARRSIVHMGIFVGFENIHFTVIHHHPSSLYTSIAANLETVHGMNSLDILKNTIYDGVSPSRTPTFKNDRRFIQSIFEKNDLCQGRTVVLIPYSVSMQPIPTIFWEQLAVSLKRHGYTVCTNSKGKREPPIKGTRAIKIPIPHMVSFLNAAGFIVGVRSGILDVTELAAIKRVVFYSDIRGMPRGQAGHNKKFYSHFPLKSWYEKIDAIELEYKDTDRKKYAEKILTYFSE